MLTEVQKTSLEMLADLKPLLEEYQISFQLSYGTALGARRHGGFIPWDDDVDIDMTAEDMQRLLKIWKSIPQNTYYLQNIWTDKYLPGLYWRIRKKNTTSMDEVGRKLPIHWGIPVDIFAVYHAPKSSLLKKMMLWIYLKAESYSYFPIYCITNLRSPILRARMLAGRILQRLLFEISRLCRRSDEVFYPEGHPIRTLSNSFFKKDIFYPAEELEFEGISFHGHHREHEYLTAMYGDYMTPPPPEKRAGHPTCITDPNRDFSEYVDYDCSRFR